MAKIPTTINGIQIAKNQFLVGPYRVLPGRLSVCKSYHSNSLNRSQEHLEISKQNCQNMEANTM